MFMSTCGWATPVKTELNRMGLSMPHLKATLALEVEGQLSKSIYKSKLRQPKDAP